MTRSARRTRFVATLATAGLALVSCSGSGDGSADTTVPAAPITEQA